MLVDMASGGRVGASLMTLRLAAGMTQGELAEAVGVGTRHLHAIEQGRVVPSPAFLRAAVSVLGERLRG